MKFVADRSILVLPAADKGIVPVSVDKKDIVLVTAYRRTGQNKVHRRY
jgi:hypothetical protein